MDDRESVNNALYSIASIVGVCEFLLKSDVPALYKPAIEFAMDHANKATVEVRRVKINSR